MGGKHNLENSFWWYQDPTVSVHAYSLKGLFYCNGGPIDFFCSYQFLSNNGRGWTHHKKGPETASQQYYCTIIRVFRELYLGKHNNHITLTFPDDAFCRYPLI